MLNQINIRKEQETLGEGEGQAALPLAAPALAAAVAAPDAPPAAALVWIVVVANHGQERRARLELASRGFEVYLPMKLSANRKGEQLASPFFPGYLFARVSLALNAWKSIYSTPGVKGVLGRGERAMGVKDALVQRIRDQEDAGFIRMGLEGEQLGRGDRVRVEVNGADIEGVFEERVDARRAMFLVSFMGRDSRFTVDLDKMRLAGGR
jgi:transcription antitermination factor NusG